MQVLFMGRLHTQPTDAILNQVKSEPVWQPYEADTVHSFYNWPMIWVEHHRLGVARSQDKLLFIDLLNNLDSGNFNQ